MKAPWFPFYTGDFLASPDVQDMEAHEVGAYVLLLARSWQSDSPGYLPDDESAMRRAARLSVDQWAHSKTMLLKKWPIAFDKAGFRFNPRLLQEADKQVELREKKAVAGQRSAEKRAKEAAERERLAALKATEGQQSVNTIPTPVESNPTGVELNGNYSQPHPQPHSSNEEGRKEGSAGEPSVGPEKASPKSQTTPTTEHPGGAALKPKQYLPDESPVFLRKNFFAYVDSIGYSNVDKGTYLMQIQTKATARKETRTDDGWKDFIMNYLNNHKRDKLLIYPESTSGPTQFRNPNNPLPAVTKMAGDINARIAAQKTENYF